MKRDDDTLMEHSILLLGISHRSGTSFVSHLMELHPDCAVSPISEDFIISESNDLVRFARRVSRRWKPFWKERRPAEDVICEFLGRGLLALLRSRTTNGGKRRLFTKTPDVRNLPLVRKIFPGCKLLIIVRDGRSVTESLARGMRLSFESAMRRWAGGARRIQDFLHETGHPLPEHLVVRYEDLVTDLRKEMRRIFGFVGLDHRKYNFREAARLPVFGSSFFQGGRPGALHWNPVAKTPDFRPLERWEHWGRARHMRFNWVAGRYLELFGYRRIEDGRTRFVSALFNVSLDLLWLGTRIMRRLLRFSGLTSR